MSKENRFRTHTTTVWQQGYEAYRALSPATQQMTAHAMDALLAALRCCGSEEELHARYWEPGDWATDLLRELLPFKADPVFLLDLEHGAFWLRSQELREDG